MSIRIELVNISDYREIFDFEKANRAFFESVLPPELKTIINMNPLRR